MTSQQTGGLKPTRRTLVKGAAWSVPVVAMGSAAPAFAASGTLDFAQVSACKNPGQSCAALPFGYQFVVTSTNTYPSDCTVTVTAATVTLVSGTLPAGWAFEVPFVVPTGTSTQSIRTSSTNSANIVFEVDVVFTYDVDCPGTEDDESGLTTRPIRLSYDGTPPDCDCPTDGTETISDASVSSQEDGATEPQGIDSAEQPPAEETTPVEPTPEGGVAETEVADPASAPAATEDN